MAVQRAYDEAAKEQRRRSILDAADGLFCTDRVLPTASRIAETAGLAKGTIYRYFDSLEALFAALLLDGWTSALQEMEDKLAADMSPADAVGAVLDSFVILIESRPVLMLLDAMLPEFKRGMSHQDRQNFNVDLSKQMMQTGRAIERVLDLPEGRGFQLLVRSHSFARGLWQSCDASDEPSTGMMIKTPSFSEELRQSLSEYWRGALN